jgi:hypothetical protein
MLLMELLSLLYMLAVTLAVARGSCTSASSKLLQLTAGGRMLQDGPSTFCFNLNPAVLSADTPCRSLLASADGFNITFQYGARASSDSMAVPRDNAICMCQAHDDLILLLLSNV